MCTMSTIVSFCLLLSTLLSISHAFSHHNHHKHPKFHRNHVRHQQKHSFFISDHHMSQFPTQTFPEPSQIDIRGAFSDIPIQNSREWGQDNLSMDQCAFSSEDFFDTASRRNTFCTWGNEFIMRRHDRRQFWCIGFLSEKLEQRKRVILTLKFDRSYQIGYVSF